MSPQYHVAAFKESDYPRAEGGHRELALLGERRLGCTCHPEVKVSEEANPTLVTILHEPTCPLQRGTAEGAAA